MNGAIPGLLAGLSIALIAAAVLIYVQRRTIKRLRFACQTWMAKYQVIQVDDLRLFSADGGPWYFFRWTPESGMEILEQADPETIELAFRKQAENKRLSALFQKLQKRQRQGKLVGVTPAELIAEIEGTGLTVVPTKEN